MKPLGTIARGALAFALTAVCLACATPEGSNESAAPPAQPVDPAKRGEYLVNTMGCHDCHTPMKLGPNGPEPDMTMMLSGHPASLTMPEPPPLPEGPWSWLGAATLTAFAGPWGVSYSANLTSDDTGMGVWTESMFMQAVKTGRHLGAGRPILPPMPWQNLARLTDEDLRAMFAYLKTVPPIQNAVPQAVVAAPPGGGQ
jgi:mono/diheme cytochrome c family protein